MTAWKIALRSLLHFWPNNLAIAIGAAIATAVLTGALVVGDSMRSSLRELTLDQLGSIDSILVSDGFFRQQLPGDIASQIQSSQNHPETPPSTSPLILFPNGTVERRDDDQVRRCANVNVMGVEESFWSFGRHGIAPTKPIAGDAVVINRSLANQLGIRDFAEEGSPYKVGGADSGRRLKLRIPKPSQMPAESALGVTDDLIETLVDLEIVEILPDQGLARFSLQPSQVSGPNLFIAIDRLQQTLGRTTLKHRSTTALCNSALFSQSQTRGPNVDFDQNANRIAIAARLRLEDAGLSLNRVTLRDPQSPAGSPVFDYWNLSSDKLIFSPSVTSSIVAAFPTAKPVVTYLANDIRIAGQKSGVPFSMVSAIEFDDDFKLLSVSDFPIDALNDDEIVLNQWAAKDLNVGVGEEIEVEYFLPETTHGQQVTATASFIVAGIAKLTKPDRPFLVRRRNQIVDAVFKQSPTLANDPDLTPQVPGVTESESIENWELPFSTAGKIRPQDDDYWNEYRTTPKAFLSPARGRQLFGSRFGVITSFRIPVDTGDREMVEQRLLQQFEIDRTDLGLRMIPIRSRSLTASSGATPFDALFLALSMFVILSALILVSLLFRLAIQGRIAEVGLLQAVGVSENRVAGIWMREMMVVCLLGSLVGIVLGVGYGWLMIYGLKTWWVGAISTPFLKLFVSPVVLLIGLAAGTLVCWGTIAWSLRQTRRQSVRQLLSGQFESTGDAVGIYGEGGHAVGRFKKSHKSTGITGPVVVVALLVAATGLMVSAFRLSGDAKAGAFMGAGFLVLGAGLLWVHRSLKTATGNTVQGLTLPNLAMMAARRNPLRSVLTIALVGVASFLIVAVSSFRLSPTESGTGGFDYIATSSGPVFADLNTPAGQSELLGDQPLDDRLTTIGMRLKPGQDASCNNLYQATQPSVIGVPQTLIDHFQNAEHSFSWSGYARPIDAAGESHNPWRLISGGDDRSEDDPIPVIIDKNTANYSLKLFALGTIYEVEYDNGQRVAFEVVGFLSNTILQGSLLIGEADFKRVFPSVAGYRYFLIDTADVPSPEDQVAVMEEALGDQGFDARSAVGVLRDFMAVQNTYLSTFQSLGGLGLLLGTFGLAAVQVRSVIERTRELGLLRAIGFGNRRIANLIFLESGWLLGVGLGVGILAALFATLPHFLFGSASVPWGELGIIFAIITATGVVTSYVASRAIARRSILKSLRD
jgi:ABC-type antimicrobial peptide transport system permease subunit